jgi:uncharacterized cupredoxin-like copper-binding protein
MSVTSEKKHEHTTEDLEAELEDLRREVASRKSTRGATQLAAFFAVLVAIAALIAVSLRLDSNQNSVTTMHNQVAGAGSGAPASASAGPAGPASMANRLGGGRVASAGGATTQVTAQLGEYWIHPSRTSVPAGKVTFVAHNVGQVPHELMIERMPIEMDAPGQPNEGAAQGMIDDMGPGESGQMTLNLTPGQYMLFCNVPGHYAQGQHMMFTVTG